MSGEKTISFIRKEELSRIYKENFSKLKRLAFMIVKDNETAEDVVHDAFTNMIEFVEKGKYEERGFMKAFLFLAVKNTSINVYRKQKKTRTASKMIEKKNEIILSSNMHFSSIESSVRINEIMKQISLLPEDNRNAFVLYLDGYKYKEISEKLGTPIGTIKSRIFFAREFLQERISMN